MNDALMFWKPRPGLAMPSAEIAQELSWGEDVEGLIDLPIKEIIDRLKAEFPRHRETPGHLSLDLEAGRAAATWTWQHVKIELSDAGDPDRQRVIAVLQEFGCTVYEA